MRPIIVYTTPMCSYCSAAKRLLAARQFEYTEVDISEDIALRERLSRENGGYRTVPMIFIGDEFIGGYTELAGLDRAGSLGEQVRGPA